MVSCRGQFVSTIVIIALPSLDISCDPTTDTPAVLARYAGDFTADRRFEWRFLTARTVPALLPVLDDFGQDVSVQLDGQGHATRALHHMLKVFLIDPHGRVREIYTLAFIQPEVMLNDIRTLALEPTSMSPFAGRFGFGLRTPHQLRRGSD